VPGVWAAGDIANYPDQIFHRRMRVEHWDNAVEQGRVAMRNMMGKLQPFIHVPYFFSDAFDLSYEFWGDADGHDQVVYRGNMNQKQLSVWWLKKQTLCAALIMNRPEEERAVAPRWILRRPRLDPKALQNARNLKSLDTTFGRTEERIRKRAYQIYVNTGCQSGRDVKNWLQAEGELKQMPDGDETEATDRERKSTGRDGNGKTSATVGLGRNQEFRKGF
jgi:hypothetical protein